MFGGHGLADGADHRRQVGLMATALQLLHDDQRFAFDGVHRERRTVARAQRGVGALRGPLDVLRRVVAPAHDDQVLDAAGDEQLALMHKAQVTGAQERPLAAGQPGTEHLGADARLAPVALAHAAALHPDLADLAGGPNAPRLGVHDLQPHVRNRLAAAHHITGAKGRRTGGRRDRLYALLRHRLSVQRQHLQRCGGARGGDRQHRLGHAVCG